jgi:hypothetical protein
MAYLQLSLLHIPARITHGNSLSLDEFSHWYTPAHILGGWNFKLRRDPITARAEHHQPAGELPFVINDLPTIPSAEPRQFSLF